MAVRELIPTKINRTGISRTGMDQAEISKLPNTRTIQMPRSLPESEDGKRVSKALYWANYYEHPDFVYEWNNGILEVKPMANIIQSDMYQWFFVLLKAFLRVHPIAKLTTLEIGFELPLDDGHRVRIPDLGVIHHDNPIPPGPEDHKYAGTFDICIESLSDSHPRHVDRDVKKKRAEYAKAGVKEYFILDNRRKRHMGFYYLTSAGVYERIPLTAEGVIRSSVLTGFQFRLDDLYEEPDLGDLVDDPIYAGFIWPEYLVEKERADTAESQAAAEKERADTAESQAKAERERAKVEKERAEAESERARVESERAEAESERADHAESQAEAERKQRQDLIAKLDKLGIDPDSL